MVPRLLFSSVAVLGLALSLPGGVQAAAKPWIQFQPAKITPKHAAKVVGANLKPNTFYFLTIAVPNFAHHSDERLFGPVRSDSHGRISENVAIPPIIACGRASVRAYPTRSKSYVSTTVMVLGCGKATHGPPPPPGRKHK